MHPQLSMKIIHHPSRPANWPPTSPATSRLLITEGARRRGALGGALAGRVGGAHMGARRRGAMAGRTWGRVGRARWCGALVWRVGRSALAGLLGLLRHPIRAQIVIRFHRATVKERKAHDGGDNR